MKPKTKRISTTKGVYNVRLRLDAHATSEPITARMGDKTGSWKCN